MLFTVCSNGSLSFTDKLYMAICSTLTCEKFLHPFKDSVSFQMMYQICTISNISLFKQFDIMKK